MTIAPPANNTDLSQWPFTPEIVPLDRCFVDPTYQRKLSTLVKKIEHHFNPALVGTLTLSQRSRNKWAIIDGQTRHEGMRRRGVKEWPAIVYTGLRPEDEARIFHLLQTERKSMASAERFQAQVAAKEPEALAIVEVLAAEGFRVEHNRTDPGVIHAIAAVEFAYRGAAVGKKARETQDPELLRDTVRVIRQAWPKLPATAKSGTIIKGLSFYLKYETPLPQGQKKPKPRKVPVDLDKLAVKLSRATPSILAKRAEDLRKGKGIRGHSPAQLAEAIDVQYHSRATRSYADD